MPQPLNYMYQNAQIADLGTATTVYFNAPQAGWLRELTLTLFAAITGADDVVTVAVDGTTVGTVTVANSGSAAGTTYSKQFNAPVKKGSRITVANSGASTGTAAVAYTLAIAG